jgi:integrase
MRAIRAGDLKWIRSVPLQERVDRRPTAICSRQASREIPVASGANETLSREGISPVGRVTFHSLRRTYASLRCACGDDVRYTADQLGHEDPRFTLRVYARATKRRDRLSGAHLKAYDRALDWARMGTSDALTVPVAEEATV